MAAITIDQDQVDTLLYALGVQNDLLVQIIIGIAVMLLLLAVIASAVVFKK